MLGVESRFDIGEAAAREHVAPAGRPERGRVDTVPEERLGESAAPVAVLQRVRVKESVITRQRRSNRTLTSARHIKKSQSSPPAAKPSPSLRQPDASTARVVTRVGPGT